jgi:pyrimidine operon attenuation protein/uracil phosphoribosyltransferase
MDAGRMARTLSRMAHEILERHPDPQQLALVGVRSRGVPLARRLARLVREVAGTELLRASTSHHRDDLPASPRSRSPRAATSRSRSTGAWSWSTTLHAAPRVPR